MVQGKPFNTIPRLKKGSYYQENNPSVEVLWKDVPEPIFDKLKLIAEKYKFPLKTILLTIHVFIVGKLSSENETCTGVVLNGRPECIDGERVLGLFLNTVPFSISLETDSWLDLIKETLSIETEIISHRRFPLAEIQKLCNGQPPFEVVFDYRQFHVYELINSNISFVELGEYFEHTNFPLTTGFVLSPKNSWLKVQIRYMSSEFSPDYIERISNYYLYCLTEICVNINQKPGFKQGIIPDNEYRLLIESWNKTYKVQELPMTISEAVCEIVKKNPFKVAVECGDISITYADLEYRSRLLATKLKKLNINNEELIGVYIDRSIEMVIVILGILRAGGAYVPLDPEYPTERLQYIVQDANLQIILSTTKLKDELLLFNTSTIIYIDELEFQLSQDINNRVVCIDCDITPHNLAYIIYTSGSTGRPKGVEICHINVMNILKFMKSELNVLSSDKLLAVTSICFDISVLEIFLPLISGATVRVVTNEIGIDALSLKEEIICSNSTIMQATPSTWKMLFNFGWKGENLRATLCGGEALPQELAMMFVANGVNLWNVYGPTETTIWSTIHFVTEIGSAIPIGRPISNTKVYVLDNNLKPVPIGSLGELFIGGVGVARGYHNRPDLNDERFLQDPYQPGSKIYKTGDIVRYSEEGIIEYFGRNDYQVKVRGFRIELGEIETILCKHPSIEGAVTKTVKSSDGSDIIVAYVTKKINAEIVHIEELLNFIAQYLPNYMVPSGIVFVNEFPLTLNGKIDRMSLPDWSTNLEMKNRKRILPRNRSEEILLELWEEILSIKEISVQDNFFHMGGHSLLALQMIMRLREFFNCELPVSILFQKNTIEQLAAVIDLQSEIESKFSINSLIPLQKNGSRLPLFLIHPMGGHVYCYFELAEELGTQYPFYAVQAPGLEGEMSPLKTIETMSKYYIELIRTVQPKGPYQLGGWCMGASISFQMANDLIIEGEEVSNLFIVSASAIEPLSIELVEDPVELMLRVFAAETNISYDEVASIPSEEEQLRYIIEGANKLNKLRGDIKSFDQAKRLLKIYKNNALALHRYKPKPLSVPIVLLRAENEVLRDNDNGDLGWQDLCKQKIKIETIKGDHYSILKKPYVKELAQRMKKVMK